MKYNTTKTVPFNFPKYNKVHKLHDQVQNDRKYNEIHHRFDNIFYPFKPSTMDIFQVIKPRPYIVQVFYC